MKPLQHERLPKTDWLYHTNSGFLLPIKAEAKREAGRIRFAGCQLAKTCHDCSIIPHVLDVNITVPAQGHELAWSARQG
jgi:hypothetical protein